MDKEKQNQHQAKVSKIQEQIKYFRDRKIKFRIYHGNTNSTRNNKKDTQKLVDISSLASILEVNAAEQYILAEANVSMDQLVDAAMEQGFVPAVVPEFPSITIGGAVQGIAGESSSFKYGCVHNVCLEYEILCADGRLVKASVAENPDLFTGIAGSYGSIGIITAVKMKLVPAEPFVKLTYRHVGSHAEAIGSIKDAAHSQVDFVDGIMFSKTRGVMMTGVFSAVKSASHATFHRATDDWFYLHAGRKTIESTIFEETIPTKDYLFRYDRGAFWVARHGFEIFHVPFNRFTRFLFVGLFKTRTLYSFLEGAKLSQQYVIQDICLPEKNAVTFMEFNDAEYSIYPLWLCPLLPDTEQYLSSTYLQTDLVINVGIWGKLKCDYLEFVARNRELESKVSEIGGRKVLYAHAYYTEAEFWDEYDGDRYQYVRNAYEAAEVFPDMYAKTHVAEQYKPSIIRGLVRMIKHALPY